jgi:uncharacterized membrane protein YeaQ/YmgE (transglycosylase-associated protein family)
LPEPELRFGDPDLEQRPEQRQPGNQQRDSAVAGGAGAVAGWLAGQIVKGYGYGLIGNIVVGVVGAFVAGLLLPRLGVGLGTGILRSIVYATFGAVVLLFLIRLLKRV